MEHPGFYDRAGPFALAVVAKAVEAELPPGTDAGRLLEDVRPLSDAGPAHLSFLDNKKYLTQLSGSRAGACLVQPAFADRLGAGTTALTTKNPYRGFALALALFYPQAMRPLVCGPTDT